MTSHTTNSNATNSNDNDHTTNNYPIPLLRKTFPLPRYGCLAFGEIDSRLIVSARG